MAVLEYIEQKRMMENIKNGILRKFPLLGATMSTLTFEPSKNIQTAGTTGEKIIYSPEFVNSLSYDERVFLFSHEIMHVAFDHIMRSKDREHRLWNIATDAVINQMLKSANLPMPQGGVDIQEAIDKSAEEMYEILQEQKKQQQKQQQQSEQSQNGDNQQEINQGQDLEDGQGLGKHDLWEEAIKQAEREAKASQQDRRRTPSPSNNPDMQNQQAQPSPSTDPSNMERQFSQDNQQMKRELADRIREDLRRQREELERGGYSSGYTSQFEDVGEAPPVISWKKILKRELEKEEDRWSYRRADEDNDFQARIGTQEVEDRPETEVMLDVSGSITDDFLKRFLRQLKPLLKESKLRVGCFDEFVYDFVDIKSTSDIDHFKVTRTSIWTENWDAAVRAFSKKRGVNKIVFTDGFPCPGVMPKEDLRKVNVIWLVFDNKRFKPCCGKVIFVDRKELYYMPPEYSDDDFEATM